MCDEPKKVEITMAPELFRIASALGDISKFVDIALTSFIASEEFYDYIYLNRIAIHKLRVARYLRELEEKKSL